VVNRKHLSLLQICSFFLTRGCCSQNSKRTKLDRFSRLCEGTLVALGVFPLSSNRNANILGSVSRGMYVFVVFFVCVALGFSCGETAQLSFKMTFLCSRLFCASLRAFFDDGSSFHSHLNALELSQNFALECKVAPDTEP